MDDSSKIKTTIRGAYFTSLISIFLVLLIVGLIGLSLLSSIGLSNYVKENLCFSILIKKQISDPDILAYKKKLDTYSFINTTEIISSEKAAEIMEKELGEDFISTLGYNPLSTTININLKSSYASPDSLAIVKEKLAEDSDIVQNISGQENLMFMVDRNMKKVNYLMFGLCAILIVISFALLNNTIRLQIYSKRNIIKSMQLIGAKNSFIRKPFLLSGLSLGLWGAILAMIPIISMKFFLLDTQIGKEIHKIDNILLGKLCAIILILGLIFSFICTYLSVNKYLQRKTDKLFY